MNMTAEANGVWEQYKKTALATQMFILTVCIGTVLLGKTPLPAAGALFLVMQACAVLGAKWAVRLKRKDTEKHGDLPLRPR